MHPRLRSLFWRCTIVGVGAMSALACGSDAATVAPGTDDHTGPASPEQANPSDDVGPTSVGDSPALTADAWLWRGFEHEWLRTAFGFRVPHRISNLTTWIEGGRFFFGQDTGVDGNFMHPVGHATRLAGTGATLIEDEVIFEWTDDADESPHPKAGQEETRSLSIDTTGLPLGSTRVTRLAAVLRGVRLETNCDPQKQPADRPCNSSGLWPYEISVDVGEPTRSGSRIVCPVQATVRRAWTPNHGGISGLAEKPFNDRLDIKLRVGLSVIGGEASAIRVSRAPFIESTANVRDDEPKATTVAVSGAPSGAFPSSLVAVGGLGFTMFPSESGEKFLHLGRYLGTLRFALARAGYDAGTGETTVSALTHVWVPDTVERSGVTYRLRPVVIQLGPELEARTTSASGSICQNSDNAPFFSKWTECGGQKQGPLRDVDEALLVP